MLLDKDKISLDHSKVAKSVKFIRPKGKRVKDPIRFPNVIEPIEKQLEQNYIKMMDSMLKMMQIEMIRQTDIVK